VSTLCYFWSISGIDIFGEIANGLRGVGETSLPPLSADTIWLVNTGNYSLIWVYCIIEAEGSPKAGDYPAIVESAFAMLKSELDAAKVDCLASLAKEWVCLSGLNDLKLYWSSWSNSVSLDLLLMVLYALKVKSLLVERDRAMSEATEGERLRSETIDLASW
jgi:hypothetical protein